MPRGFFISFEGGEGAGKSTQVKRLLAVLQQKNLPVLATREPGGTEGAEQIRRLLVEGATRFQPMTELLLHFAARHEHVEQVIRPALTAGTIVLCDRFYDSTVAYQAYGYGLGKEIVESIRLLTIGTLMPDLTFFLDLDPSSGLRRTEKRLVAPQENKYEQLGEAFHQRIYQGFKALAREAPDRIITLDASQDVDQLHHAILHTLAPFFPQLIAKNDRDYPADAPSSISAG